MKGERVRQFFNAETKALLAIYKNIETLIPSKRNKGADHVAEEGRYIESLLRSYLNKHLPQDLKAYSGFILRPATKFGKHNRTRRTTEHDQHSSQLDIIIYDSKNYPIYEQFEEFVIVPPEGVVSIISVKKNLYEDQLLKELENLQRAANLCKVKNANDETMRGPNTCLISFSNQIKLKKSFAERIDWIFSNIKKSISNTTFDECINTIIALDSFTVFKKRPSEPIFNNMANYVAFEHSTESEFHFGIQFLLTGILAAYYHETRKAESRPGYTSFPVARSHDIDLGNINVSKLR